MTAWGMAANGSSGGGGGGGGRGGKEGKGSGNGISSQAQEQHTPADQAEGVDLT